MFALLALLCFVVAQLKENVGEVDLVLLGWAFIAVHLLFPWSPWQGRGARR